MCDFPCHLSSVMTFVSITASQVISPRGQFQSLLPSLRAEKDLTLIQRQHSSASYADLFQPQRSALRCHFLLDKREPYPELRAREHFFPSVVLLQESASPCAFLQSIDV